MCRYKTHLRSYSNDGNGKRSRTVSIFTNVQNFFTYRNNMCIFAEFDDINSFFNFYPNFQIAFRRYVLYSSTIVCKLFEGEFTASSPKSLRSTQRGFRATNVIPISGCLSVVQKEFCSIRLPFFYPTRLIPEFNKLG